MKEEEILERFIEEKNIGNREQVKECIDIQKKLVKLGINKGIADIMVEKGYLTDEQLKEYSKFAKSFSSDSSSKSSTSISKIGKTERDIEVRKQKIDKLGKYKIVSKLGQGGMGIVYKGYDSSLDRYVAIKVLPPQLCNDPKFVERFKLEAKSAAQVNHHNVVQIYAIEEDKGVHYFVMELIDGGKPVSSLLAGKKRLPVDFATEIIIQTAQGLSAVYDEKKIVHRDIKPENLMITRRGIVKIADFGLAKFVESDVRLTDTGTTMGTPLYMSPEQGRAEPLDHRADIYSLGATYYHLLTGTPPFTGDTPLSVLMKHASEPIPNLKKINPKIPDNICKIIEKMMAKDKKDRYQTYGELIEDLKKVRSSISKKDSSTISSIISIPKSVQNVKSAPKQKTTDKTVSDKIKSGKQPKVEQQTKIDKKPVKKSSSKEEQEKKVTKKESPKEKTEESRSPIVIIESKGKKKGFPIKRTLFGFIALIILLFAIIMMDYFYPEYLFNGKLYDKSEKITNKVVYEYVPSAYKFIKSKLTKTGKEGSKNTGK